MAGVQRHAFFKVAATAKGAGKPHSLWTVNGQPAAGSTPATGAGAVPIRTTAGAIPLNNAATGFRNLLDQIKAAGAQVGTLLVMDRLVHTSGLDGTVTSAQTINTVAQTRPNANGSEAELWLEWYTATGSSAANVSCSYTNQDGTASRTTPSVAFEQSPVVGQCMRLPLQSGDTGVRSVQTLTLSGSTGTAGNFGVTLCRTVAMLPLIAADLAAEDFAKGLQQLYDDTCLSLVVIPSGTDVGIVMGQVGMRQAA